MFSFMNKIMKYYTTMNVTIYTIFQMMDPDAILLPDCLAVLSGAYGVARQFFAHVLEENLAYQQFWVNYTTSACPRKVYVNCKI